jgi:hypothetical protein
LFLRRSRSSLAISIGHLPKRCRESIGLLARVRAFVLWSCAQPDQPIGLRSACVHPGNQWITSSPLGSTPFRRSPSQSKIACPHTNRAGPLVRETRYTLLSKTLFPSVMMAKFSSPGLASEAPPAQAAPSKSIWLLRTVLSRVLYFPPFFIGRLWSTKRSRTRRRQPSAYCRTPPHPAMQQQVSRHPRTTLSDRNHCAGGHCRE